MKHFMLITQKSAIKIFTFIISFLSFYITHLNNVLFVYIITITKLAVLVEQNIFFNGTLLVKTDMKLNI